MTKRNPALVTHTSGLTEEDAAIAIELCESPEGTVKHLLGGLLGYWGRERLADTSAKLTALSAKPADLKKNPDVVVGLKFEGLEAPEGRGAPLAVFSFPEQELSHDVTSARGVFIANGPAKHSQASIARFDKESQSLALRWTPARVADGFHPTKLIGDDWVNPAPKPEVLCSLAKRMLSGKVESSVSIDLLEAAAPRFVVGGGPKDGLFTDNVEDSMSWVTELDGSYVAIQGPPGAGKTYTGAHLIYALIKAGRRVGITAMSHSAVENLLEATVSLFEAAGESDELFAAKKVSAAPSKGLPGVSYPTKNEDMASSRYNLVAGTTWLFASNSLLHSPVDTLVIDEAGQLSLADAVVASLAARNVVLLGDPQQLAQVSQSEHPGQSGASVLEHVLRGAPVVDSSRGVFLATTRRMHPAITEYISERFYEGQLESHESCAVQGVDGVGVGLRFLEVEHSGCTTVAPVEVEAIHDKIVELLGRYWINTSGVPQPLEVSDFMVVAPFNDQVDLLRKVLDEDPRTAKVPVGTVDKFQGREAAVVLFSLTTSSKEHLTRGVEFLFSPNRLNVAISRARCLAYLVSTKEVFSPHEDKDAQRLITHVSDFVVRATK
jgi:hypothetical protein